MSMSAKADDMEHLGRDEDGQQNCISLELSNLRLRSEHHHRLLTAIPRILDRLARFRLASPGSSAQWAGALNT